MRENNWGQYLDDVDGENTGEWRRSGAGVTRKVERRVERRRRGQGNRMETAE